MKNPKILYYLIFALVFYPSCTEELEGTNAFSTESCSTPLLAIDYNSVLEGVREQLFTYHDIWNEINAQDVYQVAEVYANRHLSRSQSAYINENFGSFETMIVQLQEESNQASFSSQLELIFTQSANEFETFMENRPELEAVLLFWRQKANLVANMDGICEAEKNIFQMTAASYSGFLEYTYHFINSDSNADFRSCSDNVWENRVCRILGFFFTVGSIFTGVALATLVAATLGPALAIIIFTSIVGLVGGGAIYQECCTWFENPLPQCNEVENILAFTNIFDCNEFTLKAYGSGADIIQWRWENVNTVPNTAITDLPQLRVTAFDPSMESTIKVFAICSDETEMDFYRKIIDLSDAPPVNNSWAIPPPTIAIASSNTEYDIATVLGANDHQIVLSWSATSGGTVIQNNTFPYKAKASFWSPGLVIITVKTISICTGESHILEKKVVVTQ